MMRVALSFVVVLLTSVTLTAQKPQPCGTVTKEAMIYGCLDTPQAYAEHPRGRELVVQGWVLSRASLQQPSMLRVYAGIADGVPELILLAPEDYAVIWRQNRPDVLQYFRRFLPIVSPYWGYTVIIRPNVLPPTLQAIALVFTDPDVGPLEQHVQQTFLQIIESE